MPYLRRLVHDAAALVPREPLDVVTGAVEHVVAHVVEAPSRVLKRESSSTSSSSSSATSCSPNDKSAACEKPQDANSLTLPIALGVVIPLSLALVIFFFLHRRHLRRLKDEDVNDKHKSLDFGMGNMAAKANRKKGQQEKGPEMMSLQDTHNEIRREGGMSLDMSSSNPYLLPPGLQASRESIHSLSRTMNQHDDRYRPATVFYPNEGSSKSPSLRQHDDSSSFTGSSRSRFPMNESRQNLLRGAQPMDRSMPPTQRNSIDSNVYSPNTPAVAAQPLIPRKPSMPFQSQTERLSPINQEAPMDFGFNRAASPASPEAVASPTEPMRRRSPPLEPPVSEPRKVEEVAAQNHSPPRKAGLPSNPRPQREVPRASSPVTVPNVSPFVPDEDDMANKEPKLPQIDIEDTTQEPPSSHGMHVQSPRDGSNGLSHWEAAEDLQAQQYAQDLGYDVRRLTMGIRPLPPDDPSENAEQRANRIRSFYKEYFDDSMAAPRHQQMQMQYYDEYSADFASYDAPIYDPDSGQFITGHTPYAEPITRRAMTPPPQGPPRFRGGVPSSGSSAFSQGGYGSRAFSTASGRFAAPKQQPKKQLPPPKPLAILPTPHMLKDDTMIPMDYAPPQSYNSRLRGTPPDSPKGGFKPFSPSLRPTQTLVSSFDDLAVLPSPHALRRSGVFTSLDFAPPPRFRDDGTASDAGSIRSNRSGMSARTTNAIRGGAYRLSRVPKTQVGSTNDMATALKPSWDMR